MKKMISYLSGLLLVALVIASPACNKKKDDECRICKALATPDAPEITEEVCSEAEEQDFRNDYPGREISCN
jgi:hypothetical protein